MKALSGGERNRLPLARLFTRPANLLVLDEPTNDLDIETLELLEALLIDWPRTLLLVSHDRAFIDHVVTSTLAFEGEGRVRNEHIGGYTDWLRQRRHAAPLPPPSSTPRTQAAAPAESMPPRAASRPTASSGTWRNCQRASPRWSASSSSRTRQRPLRDFYKETRR